MVRIHSQIEIHWYIFCGIKMVKLGPNLQIMFVLHFHLKDPTSIYCILWLYVCTDY